MANFQVSATPEQIERGKSLLDRFEGRNQGEQLAALFDVVEHSMDNYALSSGNVDVESLDAAMNTIRQLFLAAVHGRQQISKQYADQITELQSQMQHLKAQTSDELSQMRSAAQQAQSKLQNAITAQQSAEESQRASAKALSACEETLRDKQAIIDSLTRDLTAAQTKAAAYDQHQAKIRELTETLRDKDFSYTLLKKQIERVQEKHDNVEKTLQEKTLQYQDANAELAKAKEQITSLTNTLRQTEFALQSAKSEMAKDKEMYELQIKLITSDAENKLQKLLSGKSNTQ